MTKFIKHALCLLICLAIVISTVSVFAMPAFAQDAYDTAFETAFIINKEWTDAELLGDDDLTIVFRGQEKTVNPNTHKLFNSYDDAYAVAYADGNVTAENYFTYMPTFIFGPGDYSYDGVIHFPTPARIWGAQAGINPNAEVAAKDRTIEWLSENGGWPQNPERKSQYETKLGEIVLSTRIYATDNECAENSNSTYVDANGNQYNTAVGNLSYTYTDDDSKYQYMLDRALEANSTATVDYYVDGITIGDMMHLTTTDNGKTYVYQGKPYIATATYGRKSTMYFDNCVVDADKLTKAWNVTWFYQYANFTNLRQTNNATLGDRFFDKITIRDSYFTDYSSNGFLFEPWTSELSSVRRSEAELTVDSCVFYSGVNMPFYLAGDSLHKNQREFTFNLTNSLLYNAGNSSWGYFRIDNNNTQRKSQKDAGTGYTGYSFDVNREITFNIKDNTIYHTVTSNTLFNGNVEYITGGKTNIFFNGNRVIGTLSAIPPNVEYSLTQAVPKTYTIDSKTYTYTIKPANDILNYDFSGNYWAGRQSTASPMPKTAVGKMMGFASGPKEGFENCTWPSGWNWNDSDYYLDFDLKYTAKGTNIRKVEVPEGVTAEIGDDTISLETEVSEGALSAEDFKVKNMNAEVTIAQDSEFTTVVDSIDLNCGAEIETYYVKTSYGIDGYTDFDKTYTVLLSRKPYENINITEMTSENENIYKFVIDNEAKKLSFTMKSGSTADITIKTDIAYERIYWTHNLNTVNQLESISANAFYEIENTVYMHIVCGGATHTYEVTIATEDVYSFVDDYPFDDDYFGSDAVIITSKATGVSTGKPVYEEWQGKTYRFTAGVNAFDSIDDTTAKDVLIKSWTNNTDFRAERSIALYTENYDLCPYIADGYGLYSPSYGKDWKYNTEYDTYKVSVRNVIIPSAFTGEISLYGFNIMGNVRDNVRTNGKGLSLTLVNTTFTGEYGTTSASSAGSYLFQTTNNPNLKSNSNHTDTLTVKNAYINIKGKTCRLIGEPVYSKTVFDGLFVDASVSSFNEWNAYLKHKSEKSEFVIKNSCLLNLSGDKGIVFQGRYNSASSSAGVDALTGSVTLSFENNIITGALGGTQSTADAFLNVSANAYTGITIKNNYISAQDSTTKNMQLFWASGLKSADRDAITCDIEISGNVFNGFSNDYHLEEGSGGNYYGTNYEWTINNNFLTTVYKTDLVGVTGDAQYFFDRNITTLSANQYYKGYFVTAPTVMQTAPSNISEDKIHAFTFADGVTLSDDTANMHTTVVYGTVNYDFSLAKYIYTYSFKDIIAQNKYKNVMYIAYNGNRYLLSDTITVTSDTVLTTFDGASLLVLSPDGQSQTRTIKLNIKNHLTQYFEGKDAACAESGYFGYYKCTICLKNFEESIGASEITDVKTWQSSGEGYIAPTGHSLEIIDSKPASCEIDGYTWHKACIHCAYTEGYEVIPAGHVMVNYNEKAATCEESGHSAYNACVNCDYTEGYEEFSALGHIMVEIEGEDATCVEDGYTNYKVCMNGCGLEVGMQIIPATHTWGEFVYNEVEKTETRTCTSCGESETRDITENPTYRPDEHMPFVTLNDAGNGVVLDHNKSWATRVYWGCIGEEFVDYKWSDEDFRLLCGTDYFADYAPKPGETYNFTKPGWYRFVVKGIRTGTTVEDYTYSELVFDFYYDGEAAPTVPTITELGNNQIKINSNGTSIKKFYYGNIGQTNVPYSWFDRFWGTALETKTYTPVFDTRDGRIITLQTAGYYNIVIVLNDGTEYVYTTYVSGAAPVVRKADGQSKVVLDIDCLKGNVGTKATMTKLYYGYLGTEDKEISTWDEFTTNVPKRVAASNVAQGTTYNLSNKGYYKFYAVMALSNGRTIEVVYTVDNN